MMIAFALLLLADVPPPTIEAAPLVGAPTTATAMLVELRSSLEKQKCVEVVELALRVETHRLATDAERREARLSHAYCLVTLGNLHEATEKLVELRGLFEKLDCEKVIELAPFIEDHRLATEAERHEAMFRHAYCLVTIRNLPEATELMTAIVEEKIDAQPTFEVEPLVQAMVDGARGNVLKRRQDAAQEERRKIVSKLNMNVTGSKELRGGNRAEFDVELTDPDGVVRSMRVDFRKKGQPEFYALPISRRSSLASDRTWHGEVPGTYTRSLTSSVLEWYITASDVNGEPLIRTGSRDQPREQEILPGSGLAEDLTAEERLPRPARFVAAGAIIPVFTFAGVASGFVVAAVIDGVVSAIPLPDPDDDGFNEWGNVVGGSAVLFTPMLGGAAMIGLVNFAVLDPNDALIATGIAVPFLVVGELFLALDWALNPRKSSALHAFIAGVGDEGPNSDGPPIVVEDSALLGLAGLSVAVAAASGAVASVVLVAIDTPTEE